MKGKQRTGLWVILVAAAALEAISCIMYFTSRSAILHEAEQRARTELRKAELEIELHTSEMETAAKALALIVEKHIDCADSVYSATDIAVRALRTHTSMAVAFVPNYYPKKGYYYEVCSSRITEDSVYTRQIGSAEHDYTALEWYQNGFVHDSCWWCEPYMDDSGSEAPVVSCSLPIYNSKGEVVAVVCVDMALDYLQQKLPEYLQVYKNSYYSIKSSKGGDIVRVMDTIPGRKYNKFIEEIDATGWHIEIIIPEDEMFADLNRIGRIIGLLMLLGLGVLLYIVWHASRNDKRLRESTSLNQRMEHELLIARTIQMAMLPKAFPPYHDRPDLNIYGMVDPAKEVGGDLYDFYIRHDKLFFCIGDVSGKGVPAALVMAMTRSMFRSVTAHEENPAKIMTEMNDSITEQNTQNMFMTMFVGVLDCKTGMLEYCNAGHCAPIHVRRTNVRCTKDINKADEGKVERLDVVANLPLGIEAGFRYEAQQMQMHYDDMLFLYTDGLTEAENKKHEQFGEVNGERLMANGERIGSPLELVEAMCKAVEVFVDGAEQSDDLTMLAIRYQRPALFMRNDIEQIPTLSEWLEGLELPKELLMPINLALEETVTNVMMYAYPGKSGRVLVECTKERCTMYEGCKKEGKVIFTITDSGIAFDPTKRKEADITLSAEEREIGGLGIHLVRQIMDEIYYERKDEKNILTLVKMM